MYKVVDEDGEIVDHINEGDRIVRKESVEYLRETEEWKPEKGFVKTYPNALMKACEKLTGPECYLTMSLVPFIRYTTGLLSVDDSPYSSKGEIINELGMSEKTFDRSMDSLITKGIFSKNRVGREIQYFANPYLFSRGTRINKTLKAAFSKHTFGVIID